MQRVLTSSPTSSRESMGLEAFLFVAYPLFLAVEALRRGFNHATGTPENPSSVQRSVFGEARESLMIAISYIRMARAISEGFGRRTRTERPS